MATIRVNDEIIDFLQEFGLTEREIVLYLTLLQKGPSTIMNLSRETGVKRSTTHNNVEELIKKGLVSQTNFGERRMVIAEDPEKIKFLLEQKEYRVKKLSENLPSVVKVISDLVPKKLNTTMFDVRYYQGKEGHKEVTNRSLQFAEDEILQISNCEDWRKTFSEEYSNEAYIPNRLKRNIKIRALVVDNKAGRDFQKKDKGLKRTTKLLPASFDFNTTMLIYPNEVSIMMSAEPYSAILLQNKDVYQTFKEMFDGLWSIAN